MPLIPLTQGKFATVDHQDFRRVVKRKWCLFKKRDGRLYAQSNMKIGGRWRRVLLHRFIMQAELPAQVDHRNGDGLDNTRENLRLATHSQNMRNSRRKSGRFKGVSWHRRGGKWVAQILASGKQTYLGLFADEEDAARAYDLAAAEAFGEFAKLNFPR